MAKSLTTSLSKTRVLSGLLDKLSESQVETLEILADVDQLTHLMTGLLEARTGQVVTAQTAFNDL